MIRFLIYFIPLFLIATYLGIYGQDIAYWIQEHVYDILPTYYLTAICLISALLYFIAAFVAFLSLRNRMWSLMIYIYIALFLFIAGPVSLWSLWVTAMWWG